MFDSHGFSSLQFSIYKCYRRTVLSTLLLEHRGKGDVYHVSVLVLYETKIL